jgi:hypothetical protein
MRELEPEETKLMGRVGLSNGVHGGGGQGEGQGFSAPHQAGASLMSGCSFPPTYAMRDGGMQTAALLRGPAPGLGGQHFSTYQVPYW